MNFLWTLFQLISGVLILESGPEKLIRALLHLQITDLISANADYCNHHALIVPKQKYKSVRRRRWTQGCNEKHVESWESYARIDIHTPPHALWTANLDPSIRDIKFRHLTRHAFSGVRSRRRTH